MVLYKLTFDTVIHQDWPQNPTETVACNLTPQFQIIRGLLVLLRHVR